MAAQQFLCSVSLYLAWLRCGGDWVVKPRKAIGVSDETLSVTMSVRNPDRSAFKIQSGDPAQAPTGFAEIVSDGAARAQIFREFSGAEKRPNCKRICVSRW
jgi:hypothetical protein